MQATFSMSHDNQQFSTLKKFFGGICLEVIALPYSSENW